MQLDALAYCTRHEKIHPESSVRRTDVMDLHDVGATTAAELWNYHQLPGLQELDIAKLPESLKTAVAIKYPSFVLIPSSHS